jgi:phosphotransferase system enzyme I (PtsI)
MSENRQNLKLKGLAASEGIVAGRAYVLSKVRLAVPQRKIPPEQTTREIERLKQALREAVSELEQVKRELEARAAREPFFIIDAHLLLMQDEALWREVELVIEDEAINAEWAIRKVINKWKKVFTSLTDSYLR